VTWIVNSAIAICVAEEYRIPMISLPPSLRPRDKRAIEIFCEELGVPFEEDIEALRPKLAFAFGLAARDGNLYQLEKRLIDASILSASTPDEATIASERVEDNAMDDGPISRDLRISRYIRDFVSPETNMSSTGASRIEFLRWKNSMRLIPI
jgi:hypothetical protein